ncbi:MAG TPA: glutathione-disulfide reductase [Alphaproteobacteria bacterium]|nr:glutathione-disulfide reductase [Alphaproteobacteria bacterium]
MAAKFDFDLFTIGAGSGGVAASRHAASFGARVAIAESWRVGGTCVLRGCVPKKLLVYGTHFREELEDARGYGWTIEGASLDWAGLIAAKGRELDRLNGIYIRMLDESRVTIIEGRATLVDAHTIDIANRRYSAKHVLIATGGSPELPSIPGVEHAITSNEALDLERLPARIVIVGGGYIAVEFAGIFRAAGVEVIEVIRADRILRGFDGDIRSHLSAEMAKKGIDIRSGAKIARIDKMGASFRLTSETGDTLETDLVMYATGRRPNTDGIGLEAAGVHLNKAGAIAVDEWQRSTAPNIFAIGDVTDRINLTPVAIAEGRAIAETLFGGNPTRMDHADVPSAVFSQPPVGTVGMSEETARQQLGAVDVYRAVFRPMKHTLSGRDERTMMKLVVDRQSQKVVGVHMVGADAPEIIQGLSIAVKAGLTKRDFDRTVAIHPTSAEEFVLMREPVKPTAAKAAE